MSPFFGRRRDVPGTPDTTARRDRAVARSPRAVTVDVSARADAGSPTTSLHKVPATLAIAVLLSLVVVARAFRRRRDAPGTPDKTVGSDQATAQSPRADTVDVSARADAGSPTTSLHKVLATLAIAVLLSLVVAARAIVHAGSGMPDGPMRTLTLAIGQATLRVAEVTHLTWPWDRLAAALGNAPQPAVPPLLASGSAATPRPRATPTQPPAQTPRAGAVLVSAPPPPTRGRGKIPQLRADPSGTREPTPHPTPTAAARAVLPAPEAKRNLRKGYMPQPWPTQPPAGTPPMTIRTVAHATAPPPTDVAPVRSRAAGAARGAVTPSGFQLTKSSARMAGNCQRSVPPWFPCAPTSVARHQTEGGRRKAKEARPSSVFRLPPDGVDRGRAATTHQNPLWRPTPSHPLRLLVTGDSLPGYLGSILLDDAAAIGPVHGTVDVHDGTGLTRPDFVDWSLVARQQVATDHPDAVVVWMGGNDFQNMTLPDGVLFLSGTPAWTREYQRRAEICMRIWTHGGARRVYWLPMPPARDPSWAYDDAQIDTALQRAAARVPGAEYLNILGPITDHGRYADYVYENGQPVLVREADGVHVNLAGSTIVAHEVLRVLEQEWHLG